MGVVSAGVAVATFGSDLGSAYAGDALVVIVHPSVLQASFSPSELAAIFTTRKRNFDGGQRVIPLNLPPKHAIRVSFDERVLGMGPDQVARFWIDRRVRGGEAPPRHVPKPELLVRLVERLPGAIGYVPSSQVAGSVKVVHELPVGP